MLVGLAHVVARALAALRLEQWEQQEELAATSLEMERVGELAAERDHELRNGLAGLAGITHLLDPDAAGTDHEPLKHAVLAELGRLHRILDRAGADPDEADSAEPVADYLVEPVLVGLVMLRRTGRDDVHLRVQAGLRAHGHPAILAQVVTNLLANCDRHAPGATVTVTAARHGDRIAVAVRDEGPGLPPPAAGEVFERGRRDPHAGGSGLGLHISRRLITGEGGTLEVRSVDGPHGCLATVTVPVAGTPAAAGALQCSESGRTRSHDTVLLDKRGSSLRAIPDRRSGHLDCDPARCELPRTEGRAPIWVTPHWGGRAGIHVAAGPAATARPS